MSRADLLLNDAVWLEGLAFGRAGAEASRLTAISYRIRESLAALEGDAQPVAVHPDDLAVDRFADAMKAKLRWEREERGRSGWNDPNRCTVEYLASQLVEHLAKGNAGTFEDIANFAMMLHQRRADPQVLALVAMRKVLALVAMRIKSQ